MPLPPEHAAHDKRRYTRLSGVFDSDVGYPVGTFRLRDSTDYWFSIELGAGGCGPMTWRHLDLGEHCIEITPVIEQLLDTIESDPR